MYKIYSKRHIISLLFFVTYLIVFLYLNTSCTTDDSQYNIGILPQSEHEPFNGTRFTYEYLWPDGRNSLWEEDIIYFAHAINFHHPTLKRAGSPVYLPNGMLERRDFTDLTLKSKFLIIINDLIPRIPYLNDYEIIYTLWGAASTLGDIHTSVRDYFELSERWLRDIAFSGERYPFNFININDGIYCILTLKEHEIALYGRLLAINNVDINTVIQLMATVIPHENEYYVRTRASDDLINRRNLLQYLGIVGNENAVNFTFIDTGGNVFDVTASAINNFDTNSYHDFEIVQHEISQENLLGILRTNELNWYRYLHEQSLMYVRIDQFRDTDYSTLEEFYIHLLVGMRDILSYSESMIRLVIDLRGNRGGVTEHFSEIVNELIRMQHSISSTYIIIDNQSLSASVIFASLIRNNVERVLLVGEPTGQPPMFFAHQRGDIMPNSNVGFSISRDYIISWLDYEHDSLLPDIYIPLTIEDYMNSHDPVLEAILNDEIIIMLTDIQ